MPLIPWSWRPHKSAREQVFTNLRNRIYDGELRPRQRLSVNLLAAEYGVQRWVIEDAIMRLTEEGLVGYRMRGHIVLYGVPAPQPGRLETRKRRNHAGAA